MREGGEGGDGLEGVLKAALPELEVKLPVAHTKAWQWQRWQIWLLNSKQAAQLRQPDTGNPFHVQVDREGELGLGLVKEVVELNTAPPWDEEGVRFAALDGERLAFYRREIDEQVESWS